MTITEGSFLIMGPQLFNSLPANIHGLTQYTVNIFKHKLDEYLKNIPDTPQIPGYTIQKTQSHICGVTEKAEQYSWGGVTDLAREITLKIWT